MANLKELHIIAFDDGFVMKKVDDEQNTFETVHEYQNLPKERDINSAIDKVIKTKKRVVLPMHVVKLYNKGWPGAYMEFRFYNIQKPRREYEAHKN